jgi:hypothetical protein
MKTILRALSIQMKRNFRIFLTGRKNANNTQLKRKSKKSRNSPFKNKSKAKRKLGKGMK